MFLGRVGFEPQIRAVGSYLTANSATVTANSATVTANSATVTAQLILFHFMAYSMCLKRKIKSFVSVIIKVSKPLTSGYGSNCFATCSAAIFGID